MRKTMLGGGMYVFSNGGTRSRELLISSHGVHLGLLGGKIKVPSWTELTFFTPHGKALTDPGVGAVIEGRVAPAEVKGPGDMVPNYRLSKYQGKHNRAGETYDSIKAILSKSKWKVDVLTIRNRWWQFNAGVTLNEVLNELALFGYQYPFIYCSFCRSGLI